MNNNPLYASASPLVTAVRNAESTSPAVAANGPVLVDAQALMRIIEEVNRRERIACQDWVNKRLSVLTTNKYLYRTNEAKAALGCGTSKLYDLINNGALDARKLEHRTYITAESLEAFVASLPAWSSRQEDAAE
jgi:hypothetical protein